MCLFYLCIGPTKINEKHWLLKCMFFCWDSDHLLDFAPLSYVTAANSCLWWLHIDWTIMIQLHCTILIQFALTFSTCQCFLSCINIMVLNGSTWLLPKIRGCPWKEKEHINQEKTADCDYELDNDQKWPNQCCPCVFWQRWTHPVRWLLIWLRLSGSKLSCFFSLEHGIMGLVSIYHFCFFMVTTDRPLKKPRFSCNQNATEFDRPTHCMAMHVSRRSSGSRGGQATKLLTGPRHVWSLATPAVSIQSFGQRSTSCDTSEPLPVRLPALLHSFRRKRNPTTIPTRRSKKRSGSKCGRRRRRCIAKSEWQKGETWCAIWVFNTCGWSLLVGPGGQIDPKRATYDAELIELYIRRVFFSQELQPPIP